MKGKSMKVSDIKNWLSQFDDNEEIIITAMDDHFSCSDFELHSPYEDGQAQEIILPYYIGKVFKEPFYGAKSIVSMEIDSEHSSWSFDFESLNDYPRIKKFIQEHEPTYYEALQKGIIDYIEVWNEIY